MVCAGYSMTVCWCVMVRCKYSWWLSQTIKWLLHHWEGCNAFWGWWDRLPTKWFKGMPQESCGSSLAKVVSFTSHTHHTTPTCITWQPPSTTQCWKSSVVKCSETKLTTTFSPGCKINHIYFRKTTITVFCGLVTVQTISHEHHLMPQWYNRNYTAE